MSDDEYRIGVNDVLAVAVMQAPELSATVRVSQRGEISLPLLGSVSVAGSTLPELEQTLEQRLGEKYIREPEVTVQATDVQSQAVSVVGAVKKPGVVQVRGVRTLLEVLSLAGGLADEAGDTVFVVRQGATGFAASAGVKPVEIPLKSLMTSLDPQLNVAVQPGDLVNVQSAAIVYVVGAVRKPGAFVVRGNDRLTVLRALALGEGLAPTAAQGAAVVLRTDEGGERTEIGVDLGGVLKGKVPDIPLEAHDVLFIPTSGSKVATRATLEVLTRLVTFHPGF